MFTANHEDVYRFQIENSGYDPIIKTIQRSYGGAFDGYVKIKESDLSNRLKISYQDVVKHLNTLQQLEILSYLPQTDQPQLQFVLPRADQLHLDIDVKYIKLRQQIQMDQIKAVLAYSSTFKCRSQQLLAYFGETNADKCEFCDVCLAERKLIDAAQVNDKIDFEMYVKGLITFSNVYKGKLVSETMLVKGLNDTPEELNQVVTVLKSVQPSIAYISVPTRPPAVKSVLPPDEEDINLAYQLFSENQLKTELILGFEGTDTGFTGNAIDDILNICSVHPIRQDTMDELLKKKSG